MATSLKVQLGSDIRRLSPSQLTTYAEFTKLVRTIFNISDLNGIRLAYQDEDSDWINIRSDMDLDEARRFSAPLTSFKIVVTMTDGIPSVAGSEEPMYPQLAPEDIDLTNSFAELMTDSMQKAEELPKHEEPSSAARDAAQTANNNASHSGASEDHTNPITNEGKEGGVLGTVENQFKLALTHFLAFMESLRLDEKMKQLVAEFEPTFAKFEERVLTPLNAMGQRASQQLEAEFQSFQRELNHFKARLAMHVAQLNQAQPALPSHANEPAPIAPLPFLPPPNAPNAPNAMQDLLSLESMGFTDRRRNLELLAEHKGDMNAVVDALLQ